MRHVEAEVNRRYPFARRGGRKRNISRKEQEVEESNQEEHCMEVFPTGKPPEGRRSEDKPSRRETFPTRRRSDCVVVISPITTQTKRWLMSVNRLEGNGFM